MAKWDQQYPDPTRQIKCGPSPSSVLLNWIFCRIAFRSGRRILEIVQQYIEKKSSCCILADLLQYGDMIEAFLIAHFIRGTFYWSGLNLLV